MVIGVGILSATSGFASHVCTHEDRMIGIGHAARGKPATHRFELGHHFEHFQEPLRCHLCHDCAAARAQHHDAHRGELDQRLAQRGAGYPKSLSELGFFKVHSRRKGARRDAFFDRFAQLFGTGSGFDLHRRSFLFGATYKSGATLAAPNCIQENDFRIPAPEPKMGGNIARPERALRMVMTGAAFA